MAERNVNGNAPLPQKIEQRLADLVQMGEFDQCDVKQCRAGYWSARDTWHTILVDCYDSAIRHSRGARSR
jgi:hypothetical protein